MNKYFIILVFFLISSCIDNSKKETEENTSLVKKEVLTKGLISKLKFNDILLDKPAKVLVEEWKSYTAIDQAILNIKDLNFSFFTEQEDIFNSTLLELKTTIPENIDSQPINARVLVLQNQLYRFQEELKIKKQLEKDDLIFIKDVFVAFSNLNLQINKKLEKEEQQIIKPE
ncbi:hypothetical protein [Aurantibacter sp.]|uniref:hypothetical protein n=1 Tax=Aurantibacter sp. TaxID=2807103 RepID=UPI0035C7FD9A